MKSIAGAAGFIFLTSLLGACGFGLRGEQETLAFSFPELSVQCSRQSEFRLCHYLNSRIKASGTEIPDDSQYLLSIQRRESTQRAFTLRNDATAAEYELTHRIEYSLRDKSSKEKLSGRIVSRRQIYRHNASALIAKDREQESIELQLDQAIIDTILREVSLLKR